MARPPQRGVGVTCTSRPRGQATAPSLIASSRTGPTRRKVMTAAVSPASRYSRMGSTSVGTPRRYPQAEPHLHETFGAPLLYGFTAPDTIAGWVHQGSER